MGRNKKNTAQELQIILFKLFFSFIKLFYSLITNSAYVALKKTTKVLIEHTLMQDKTLLNYKEQKSNA